MNESKLVGAKKELATSILQNRTSNSFQSFWGEVQIAQGFVTSGDIPLECLASESEQAGLQEASYEAAQTLLEAVAGLGRDKRCKIRMIRCVLPIMDPDGFWLGFGYAFELPEQVRQTDAEQNAQDYALLLNATKKKVHVAERNPMFSTGEWFCQVL